MSDRFRLILGDAMQMPLADCSVDSIVTDPPYGLEFMGKEWDKLARPKSGNIGGFADGNKPSFERVRLHLPEMQAWHARWASEALRVLKPGGHLLAFGGTRTYHRLTCALEDSGFEIRDCLMWLYGSGFPKSKNIGDGWGTALKPAWEPVILARKPLSEPNVAANVKRWGVGAINVDGCRIEAGADDYDHWREPNNIKPHTGFEGKSFAMGQRSMPQPHEKGRWPANVLLDDESAAMLDEQAGERIVGSGSINRNGDRQMDGWGLSSQTTGMAYGDSGGASRFFYCAKAARSERNAGCSTLPEKPLRWSAGDQNPGSFQAENTHKAARNHHPTVKPVDLMRYLCRLITPRGGIVLDCFVGSGSTGIAAIEEGFRFVGIDRDPEYLAIASARLAKTTEQGVLFGASA